MINFFVSNIWRNNQKCRDEKYEAASEYLKIINYSFIQECRKDYLSDRIYSGVCNERFCEFTYN